jgi:hypothetical protein
MKWLLPNLIWHMLLIWLASGFSGTLEVLWIMKLCLQEEKKGFISIVGYINVDYAVVLDRTFDYLIKKLICIQ